MSNTIIKSARQFLVKNSPTVMAGLASAGVISTTVLGVKATPKALLLIEEETKNKHRKLSKKEIIKLTWKSYIPTIVMGTITIGCIVCSNSINLKRNTALASMYTLAETSLKNYQDKVVEVVGEKKAVKIRDEVYEEEIKKNPVINENIVITGKGDMLCFERTSGRYFKSDIEHIRKVRNNMNETLLSDGFVSLNELYYQLGLPETSIGEYWGWDINRGQIEIIYSSQLSENGVPCLVIDAEPYYFSE